MTRICIIDDELESAQAARRDVENVADTTADVALEGGEARAIARRAIEEGQPYDLFIIDLLLDGGEDGIDVMKALRQISPDTDAVLLTGFGDAEQGLRAHREGAFRYLYKPYLPEEMAFLVESVKERRRALQEHGWERILRETTEKGLQEREFQPMAEGIVQDALRLGFQRAHLFWVPEHRRVLRENRFVGIACAGTGCIPEFAGWFYSLDEWFDLQRLDSQGIGLSMQSAALKAGSGAAAAGYEAPRTDAVLLPLMQGAQVVGVLLLDYGPLEKRPSQQERLLLSLFARQVSLLLNHAVMLGQEQWKQKRSSIIQRISRQITSAAAAGNLRSLLEEIRRQLSEVMDVSNFAIVLDDQEMGQLDLQLVYRNGRPRKRARQQTGSGLEGYLLGMADGEPLLIEEDVAGFVSERGIELDGPAPLSWLGAPLRTGDQTIGAMVVYQADAKTEAYQEDHKNILRSVADQIAGAIEISRKAEAEQEDARRMQVLQKASMEMLRIAREGEQQLWFTLLTIATSGFGLGFNRALLFRCHETSPQMRGAMGVGTEDTERAKRDWEKDAKRAYRFDDFLRDLGTRRMRHTPFEKLVKEVQFDLPERENALSSVIEQGRRLCLREDELEAKLPSALTECFRLSDCAILPLRAGQRTLGVVIVDNKHNRQPLSEPLLDRLQTLLDIAGLVWESGQQREKSEDLLRINQEILTEAQEQPLQATLQMICRTARSFTEADWAIIFPLDSSDRQRFDLANIGYDGTLSQPIQKLITADARVGEISNYVLEKGDLVVEDVLAQHGPIEPLQLPEHHFIKSEKVRSLFGVPVRYSDDDEPLGLLYLDYRQPRQFSERDRLHAHSFASLAAMALFNSVERIRQRKHLRTAVDIAETVGTGLDLEHTMDAILKSLKQVFENTNMCFLLYDRDLNVLRFAPASARYYHVRNADYKKTDAFELGSRGIACRVASKSLQTKSMEVQNIGDVLRDPDYLPLDPRTRSQLTASLLNTKDELLGVVILERDWENAFSEEDEDLVRAVSQELSTALERAQQSEALDFKSMIAAQTVWAAEMAHEFNNEIGQIRDAAYLLRNLAEDNPELLEYVDWIEQSAKRLYESGPQDDETDQVVQADTVLKRILPGIIEQRGIRMSLRTNAPNAYIKVNFVGLQRVFRHLARNASRAMINSKQRRITITTHLVGGSKLEILFEDSGPGIKDDLRPSIFHRRVKTRDRGGYGLLVARQMIEDMRGEIILLPFRRGHGATFSIRFPLTASLDENVE